MPDKSTNVFVSYSHADTSLVAPVVKLLRVNKSLVFQDIDDIQPGKKWRNEIARGLAESNLVVVFWCDHARQSDEMAKEWKAAVEQNKDLLPVLLDATPLPPELGEFQWIDFRAAVGANHTPITSPADQAVAGQPPTSPPKKSRRGLLLGSLATLLVAAVVVGGLFTQTAPVAVIAPAPPVAVIVPAPPVTEIAPAPAVPVPHQPAPSGVSEMFLSGGAPFWLALLLAITSCLGWLLRRRSKRREALERARAPGHETERQIARELEAEICRRAALKHDAGASTPDIG